MTKLLLATRNAKKLGELRRILEAEGIQGVEVLGLNDVEEFPEAPETAPDFEGNAEAKARDAVAATGLPAIADDSGLSVDALNGMPGVLSVYWAGRARDDAANLRLVLEQIEDVPDERRGAAFVCAAAAATPDGRSVVVEGRMAGTILRAPRGDRGFGYDPIFLPVGETRTNAELPPDAKDAISHRGKAFRALAPLLADLLR